MACWVARIGYSGELGYELFCRSEEAEGLWDALLACRGMPYGLAAAETLRIEAGLILIGKDYIPHQSTPFDVSLDRLVRLKKEGFIGKKALESIVSPPRRLVTVVAESNAVIPSAGTAITTKGSTIGSVTSSCWSPTFGATVALAVVERAAVEEGSSVELQLPAETLPGTLRTAPLQDPDRTRTRS